MKIPEDMKRGTIHPTKFNGDLEILQYNGALSVDIMFVETGTVLLGVRAELIRKGTSIKDPMRPIVQGMGFIGVGEFKSKKGTKHTPEYSAWNSMLKRCYSEKVHERQPHYIGCTVCSAWLNFQTFAAWFVPRYSEGLHLDKDGLVEGNKVYSPETCQLIPQELNNQLSKKGKYTLVNNTGNTITGNTQKELCDAIGASAAGVSMVLSGKRKTVKGWRNLNG